MLKMQSYNRKVSVTYSTYNHIFIYYIHFMLKLDCKIYDYVQICKTKR